MAVRERPFTLTSCIWLIQDSYAVSHSSQLILSTSTRSYAFSNGLNILPSYTNYFQLDDATTGLQTASVFIGGILAPLFWGQVTDAVGRRVSLFLAVSQAKTNVWTTKL